MSSQINKLNLYLPIPQEINAAQSPRPGLARRHDLFESALQRIFKFIASKLPSGLLEPLGLLFLGQLILLF